MKTKRLLILFQAVFVIVSILLSCNSVGFAQGASIIIESQQIRISQDKDYWFCIDLSQDTQCPEIISISYDACKTKMPFDEKAGYDRPEFFKNVLPGRKINNIVGLFFNHFIIDVEGNTTYYCTPRRCYPR